MIEVLCEKSGRVCRGRISGNLNHVLREATAISLMVANQLCGGNVSARNILIDSLVDRLLECKQCPIVLGKDMKKEDKKDERTEQTGAVLCAGGDEPAAEA